MFMKNHVSLDKSQTKQNKCDLHRGRCWIMQLIMHARQKISYHSLRKKYSIANIAIVLTPPPKKNTHTQKPKQTVIKLIPLCAQFAN